MATIKAINSKRRVEKASITRALTYVEHPPEDISIAQIESRMGRLDAAYEELKELTKTLYDYDGDEDFVDPEADFSEYEEKYFRARAMFVERYDELKPRGENPDPQNEAFVRLAEQHSSLMNRLETPLNGNMGGNDLPKIRIEPFTGKYKDWPAFKDIFISAIDSKPNLSNIQKFHYLKSVLKDEAANLIKHMQISESSYATAWDRLKERFDRPRHIVNSYIDTFMALPSIKEETSTGLRKISDISNEVIRGLEAINYDERDHWLIYILLSKLDTGSRRKWVEITRDEVKPTIADFLMFLDQRCEEIELGKGAEKRSHNKLSTSKHNSSTALVATNEVKNCSDCFSSEHQTHKCQHFLSLSVDQRRKLVKEKSLCFNCLRKGHTVHNCKSKFKCRYCHRTHNSLLHNSEVSDKTQNEGSFRTSSMNTPIGQGNQQVSLSTLASHPEHHSNMGVDYKHILPTALASVSNSVGKLVTCRILLDTASEYSYITEDCMKRLGLSRNASRMPLSGIQSVKAEPTRGHTYIHVKSRHSHHSIDTVVHVLGKITACLPKCSISRFDADLLNNLQLADPGWNCSSPVDILLGADEVWEILLMDKIRNDQGKVIAISSNFGWVVTSSIMSCQNHVPATLLTLADIDNSIRAFWEIEESPNFTRKVEDESQIVEQHFSETHSRHKDGKYIVELPFKEQHVAFGDTHNGALVRFHATERRLAKDPELKIQYVKFMQEYQSLGHMRELSPNEITVSGDQVYYLPHHPVLGTKLRVVFDGSFQDTNGLSLNDTLHIGPSIQRNLFSVCLRFRLYKFVFSADIVKMFRQIWVAEKHRNFQRIVWRENPDQQLRYFQLCTVTYGTASAPFLSVRVLEQIAKDYERLYPNATRILREDFYVDDVLTGASSEQQLLENRNELVELLSQAQLQLSKWVSNSKAMATTNQTTPSFLEGDHINSTKVLGIHWDPAGDIIVYKICLGNSQCFTKRSILSDVARIFDPLGLISPVVINFKILFQELWLKNLSWDDPLPSDLLNTWLKYREDLKNLDDLKLKRFVPNGSAEITLHGFSDASLKAYSAVVYCLSKDEKGGSSVTLLASKTRVSPLKQISLPRLELCGALLLTRLMKSITSSLFHKNTTVHAWCDSTIVLSWLSMQPIRLKTFVGNRTSEILETLPRNVWGHVSTKENPADCASRGMMADQLLCHELWWSGPSFIKNSDLQKGHTSTVTSDGEEVKAEMKASLTFSLTTRQDTVHALEGALENTSSWWKLLRVTAYVRRFINNRIFRIKNPEKYLTFDEITGAKITCIKMAQNCFSNERKKLQQGLDISSNSQILRLSPYIDRQGLIRVGGRIQHAELADSIQHPIILPKKHKITMLIIQEQHERHLHPGVSALFVIIRQQYWIIGARNLIRQTTHKCLSCFRQAQHTAQQRMADLPSVRVRQAFPFQNTGCDYAGPLTLRIHPGRNVRTTKGYICLFVCMVTSAIHIELATDMSTECFIAALRRFMARRGKCSEIFSDNGRNFVGAKRALNEMYTLLQDETHNNIISTTLARDGIKWSFTPPYSPHWGGMWESGIRSVKMHLKRVIGNSVLTHEQMHTLLAQIEAVVNSRPLGYASDTETTYLSPSHFLIGRPTTMIPDADLTNLPSNRLSYWQHIQCMYQGFWKQWSQEYLTSLQNRPKWCKYEPNIAVDDIVLVKEDKIPPSSWILARVIEVLPGKDGLVRAVKLKTDSGIFTRNITRIIKLPVC